MTTDSEKLVAVAWAARKANTTYGKFMAKQTHATLERIYRDYKDEKARRRRERHRRA